MTDLTIKIKRIKSTRPVGEAEDSGSPIYARRRRRILARRSSRQTIRFFDLAWYDPGGGFVTYPMSFGGPFVHAQAAWADMRPAFNFPLSIPLDQWAEVFHPLTTNFRILALLTTMDGTVHDQVTVDEQGRYSPPGLGNILSLAISNRSKVGDGDDYTEVYHEPQGLFDYFDTALGVWTAEPDPEASPVSLDVNFSGSFDVFLPPAPVRVTGEWYDGMTGFPDGGFTPANGPWTLAPYPDAKATWVTDGDCDTSVSFMDVYYRILANGSIQWDPFPDMVNPAFLVCGINSDELGTGGLGFSPPRYEFNSPTVFWDRENVLDNYMAGPRTTNYPEMAAQRCMVMRLQGGDNVELINNIWVAGTDNDEMTFSRVEIGGSGSSDPILSGAIRQGGKWFFRWRT